jgi:hypothetical protein
LYLTRQTKEHFSQYSRFGGGVLALANASLVHPRDPGSNLSIDRQYFLVLFVSHLNSNL